MEKIIQELQLPLMTEDLQKLAVGDLVAFTGSLITGRDRFHKRIAEEGQLPWPDTSPSNVLYHTGPIVTKNETWKIVCSNPTGSMRMAKWLPQVIERLGLKAILGKTGVPASLLKGTDCIYLSGVGSWVGALYANKVKRVEDVYWLEFGQPEACWQLYVESFGPFIVETDLQGHSIYQEQETLILERLHALKTEYF